MAGRSLYAAILQNPDQKTYDLTLYAAVTDDERIQGFRGVSQLLPQHGMVFKWSLPLKPTMEMGGMLFALDMLFLDKAGKVIDMVQGLQPGLDDTYQPRWPAMFVVELNHGQIQQLNIQLGSIVILPRNLHEGRG
ncbi:DUF192 domain-containing protein [Alphaproteobacteria bacterium]|nr:DUF192 domain-containing protein [Alphaproteobacteria bacterium]